MFSDIAKIDNPDAESIHRIPKDYTLLRSPERTKSPMDSYINTIEDHSRPRAPSPPMPLRRHPFTYPHRTNLLDHSQHLTPHYSNDKLASTQDKSPHPIDHRSHTARTNTADLGQLGQIPPETVKEKVSSPTRSTSLLIPPRRPVHHQYNPCRGSSIGRACGSYNSKEINLKVVGSSPTFGYSYTISSSEQLFFCFLVRTASGSVLRRAAKVAERRGCLRHPCVAFLTLKVKSLNMISFSFTAPRLSTQPYGTSACLRRQYCPSAPQARQHPTCS
jgi:hypothetical protein